MENNRFRLTLRQVILGELVAMTASFGAAWFVPSLQAEAGYLGGMALVFLVMHGALVPLRGFDFIIHDERPDSPIKYYWFLSIFVAAFLGGFVADAFFGGPG